MSYNLLTPIERIARIHVDLMSDPEFSRIGPATQIGVAYIAGPECPTAKTDGKDCWYNEGWVMRLSRGQLRYVVAHEQLHKLYQHCTAYNPEFRKYPEEAGQAVDYVVNLMVEEMDNGRDFVQRPTDIPPLLDVKYRGWSCLEVLADLVKDKQGGGGGKAKTGSALDEHVQREDSTPEEQAQEKQLLDDARMQGEITSARLRGESAGSASLKGFEQSETNWRDPLRQFMTEHMDGHDLSRWCPPNKLFRPLGIMLPSHYTENVGDLVIACDTSGSMSPYYATVFGEIGRVCEQVQPKSVTVIWWDGDVRGVQVFGPGDYLTMKDKLKAVGGGGTTVSCVARFMRAKKMRPQATIMLTDGLIEDRYECPEGPLLWAVVGHSRFTPIKGKLLRIGKERL